MRNNLLPDFIKGIKFPETLDPENVATKEWVDDQMELVRHNCEIAQENLIRNMAIGVREEPILANSVPYGFAQIKDGILPPPSTFTTTEGDTVVELTVSTEDGKDITSSITVEGDKLIMSDSVTPGKVNVTMNGVKVPLTPRTSNSIPLRRVKVKPLSESTLNEKKNAKSNSRKNSKAAKKSRKKNRK